MSRLLLLGGVVAVFVISLAGCSQEQSGGETTSGDPVDSVTIELVSSDSLSAFEVLAQSHEVDHQSTAMGVFVKGIDSVANGGGFYWIYSVNGEKPKTAADKYMVSPGDTVRWIFRGYR